MKTAHMEPINSIDFKTAAWRFLSTWLEPAVRGVLKGGQPVAELSPAVRSSAAYPQYELKGTVTVVGDITEPAVPADQWESTRR